jgi:hypothetical protein
MKPWKYKLSIKHLLTDEETPEAIANASLGIAKELKGVFPQWLDWDSGGYDIDLETMVDYFSNNDLEAVQYDLEQGYNPLENFNGYLSDLYDWADYNRVWLG